MRQRLLSQLAVVFVASALVLGCSSGGSLPFQNRVDPSDLDPDAFTLPIPCGTKFRMEPLSDDEGGGVAFYDVPEGTPLLSIASQEGEEDEWEIAEGDVTYGATHYLRPPNFGQPSFEIRYAIAAGGAISVPLGRLAERGAPIGEVRGALETDEADEVTDANIVLRVHKRWLEEPYIDFVDLTTSFVGCVDTSDDSADPLAPPEQEGPPDLADGWQRHTGSSVQIDLPSEWQVQEDFYEVLEQSVGLDEPSFAATLSYILERGGPELFAREPISGASMMTFATDRGAATTPNEEVDSVEGGTLGLLDVVSTESSLDIAGLPAARIDMRAAGRSSVRRQRRQYIIGASKPLLYFVIFAADEEDFAEIAPLFEDIIETFRIVRWPMVQPRDE
jgi:hypothetical protein